MKTYVVGGAVRDELLGLAVKDRDHVVVGATPAQMAALGFRPVGADFPVFLHPETHEEFALARTERKTAPGYRGFVFHAAPDVTLEEDLRRRDLTINAMAREAGGRLIDPCGGERDLRLGVLRHVGPAFAEDPVRILRVARFAARFGFSVAPETQALMAAMVASGEVDALVPERVWQEMARGLMEPAPSRLLEVLRDCGALPRVLPEIAAAGGAADLASRLDRAAGLGAPLPVRFALLALDTSAPSCVALAARINAPNDCRELAQLAVRERDVVRGANPDSAESVLGFLERTDAFRRPDRLRLLLRVARCASADAAGAEVLERRTFEALGAAQALDAGKIAAAHPDRIAQAIHEARLAAVTAATALRPPK